MTDPVTPTPPERAVEVAAAKIARFGWPYRDQAAACAEQMLTAAMSPELGADRLVPAAELDDLWTKLGEAMSEWNAAALEVERLRAVIAEQSAERVRAASPSSDTESEGQ